MRVPLSCIKSSTHGVHKQFGFVIASIFVMAFSGCAFLNAQGKCEEWKSEGKMYSTIDACAKCVRSLGSTNYEAVSGCAVGMDAATLLNTTVPRQAAPLP